MRTDDKHLQDASVYHEADCANRAETQELFQGSTRGDAICR